MIKENFNLVEAETILNLPLRKGKSKDEIIWNLDKRGMFSIKSVYHLTMTLSYKDEASVSDLSKQSSMWKALWKLEIIPRAKICIWKIIKDIIPTKENIQYKRIDTNPICVLCEA